MEKIEDIIVIGDKVKHIKTEEVEYDLIEYIIQKEKELEEHIEGVRLYVEAADNIEAQLKKDIKKLKNLK